jgi:glycosyltransferase involved in cell wall biosynthesis
MKKPLICQISDFSPEYGGSFIEALLSLARHCRDKMGLETLCLFPGESRGKAWLQKFDEEGTRYAFIPRRRTFPFYLDSLLRNNTPLLFHSHFSTFDLAAVFAKLIFYRKAQVVWHFHSSGILTTRQRIKDLFKVQLIARSFVSRFIAVSDDAYHYTMKRGYLRNNTSLVYNGINTSRFYFHAFNRQRIRNSLGVKGDQVVFLLLGWDPFRKGVDLFIRAAEATARAHQSAVFLIVGRKETKEFVSRCEGLSSLGTSLRVIDPVIDFPLFLSGIDVFVSPSRREGLSYAVLEAMAAGRVIISSDSPGVRSTYANSAGVWIFPQEDWKRLAQLFRMACEFSALEWTNFGRLNSEYVAEHHSLETWTKCIAGIYGELIGNESG